MRKRIGIEARLDHPVEAVFAYLADPRRWSDFAPAVVLRRQIGDGSPSVGTQWAAIDRIGPLKVQFVEELVALETNERVVWASSAPWNALTEYRCVGDAAGTRVWATYDGDVDGWLRILALVPSSLIGVVLSGDFRRLAAVLRMERAAMGPRAVGARPFD